MRIKVIGDFDSSDFNGRMGMIDSNGLKRE